MSRRPVCVESLFWLPSGGAAVPSARELLPRFRDVSSLQGITYWSASGKKERVLFSESRLLPDASPRSRAPSLPRPSPLAEDEAAFTFRCFQKDRIFGGNRYRTGLRAEGGVLAMETVNETALSFGPLRIAAPEAYSSMVIVIPAGGGLLVWALSALDGPLPDIARGSVADSFGNRAAALALWLGDQFRFADFIRR